MEPKKRKQKKEENTGATFEKRVDSLFREPEQVEEHEEEEEEEEQ
jgi:hypothetical protein